MQAPLDDAQALSLLHHELSHLAAELGRMPSAEHVQTLLARLGLDRVRVRRLLDLAVPQPTLNYGKPPLSPALTAPVPGVAVPGSTIRPLPPPGGRLASDPTPAASNSSPEQTPPADEDDWNTVDPFAVVDPQPPLVLPQDPAVARLVEDLEGDSFRSGQLHRSTLTSLARRRGLSAEQVEETLLELASRGVDVEDDIVPTGYDGRHDLDGGAVRRQVGFAERDQLANYLAQLRRYPLLTAEDEVRLGRAIAAGRQAAEELAKRAVLTGEVADEQGDVAGQLGPVATAGRRAHEQMVCANLRLVVSVAKLAKYTYSGVDLPDRIQDGNSGLLHAVDMFDPELGYKFSTYATWWIRQKIERGIADRGRVIRLPVHMHEQVRRLQAARFQLELELGRSSTIPELADCTGQDPGKVAAMLRYGAGVGSLDATVGTDGNITLGDLLSLDADIDGRLDPAAVVLNAALDRELAAAVKNALSDRDGYVIQRRYGLDGQAEQTLQDIGAELGLTRERIRQIENKALKQLSAHAASTGLFEYLVDMARKDTVHPRQAVTAEGSSQGRGPGSTQPANEQQDHQGDGWRGAPDPAPPLADDISARDAGSTA